MRFSVGRRLLVVALFGVVLVGLVALPAASNPLRTNGQITFARFNPALGDTQVYVVNPDGVGGARLVQGPTDAGEIPQWFPDGAHIAACCALPGGGAWIINPDDGTFRIVGGEDPRLFNPCSIPSPDGRLLLCETFSDDGTQNGIHSIRASDGGGFTQITSNPGGDDAIGAGAWSPNGNWIVFARFGADGSYEGVFLVHPNGTGLKRILPPTVSANCCTFAWSPQGNEIAFSRHVTSDVHSSLWIVHSDGSGLRPVSVPASLGCGGANSDPSAVGCLQPAWSPDGTKIAFASGLNLDVDGNIYTVNTDGTDLTQVTHTGGASTPEWGTHPPTA